MLYAFSKASKADQLLLFDCVQKGEVVKVENADTYTITNVSRENSGEYKCSLIDDPTMEASEDITVKCKGTRQNRNHSFAR